MPGGVRAGAGDRPGYSICLKQLGGPFSVTLYPPLQRAVDPVVKF
jgi:hypothetical protein